MKLLGFEITRAKAAPLLAPVPSRGSWWGIIGEYYAGAWQQNVEVNRDTVLCYSAAYSCITLIAADIAKMRVRLLQQQDSGGIWSETESPAFSPVLRKPNHYQTRIKFFEQWITSKLIHGNTYVLKQRDDRGVVTALYVLDPCRVRPLVATNGDVFYELRRDDLSGLDGESIVVPAREIIHDIMVALYHPLVGVSPIHACGLAATQGLRIQQNSAHFFGNGGRPSGILSAPGAIGDETAARLKAHWEANYSGRNAGKVAVLGDGLKFEAMTMSSVDAQLIEQLKWTAETVCSCFHVPPYMISVGPPPNYNNIEALNQQYYSQCLQALIESIEISLDEGLALPRQYGTEFDLKGLLRMDTAAKVKAAADAIKAGYLAPNEARADFDLAPVEGGDTPYLQQQNYSLAALGKRDQSEDPFGKTPAPGPAPHPPAGGEEESVDEREFVEAMSRPELQRILNAA